MSTGQLLLSTVEPGRRDTEAAETAGLGPPLPSAACEGCGGKCQTAGFCAPAVEVATEWMLEFIFRCLCAHFQQQRMEQFYLSRSTAEAIILEIPELDEEKRRTVHLCQFLSRIADGRDFDAQFLEDKNITPLEAALLVWESMEKEHENVAVLHEEIQLLVQIQAVTVCMEKGNYKQAKEVLNRLFVGEDSNKSVRMKLAMIIHKKDPYHQFLQSFSYNRMLKKINSFVDIVLSERPSNFLLQAATRVVKAKRKVTPQLEENEKEIDNEINYEKERSSTNHISKANKDTRLNENTDANANERETSCQKRKRAHTVHNLIHEANGETQLPRNEDQLRAHKRLFSVQLHKPWNPEQQSSLKKLTAKKRLSNNRSIKSLEKRNVHSAHSNEVVTKKKKRLWMPEEDEQLQKGVKEFGVGSWSRILLHYNFENRTGVMLKDRWRTMQKLHIVGRQSDRF